MKTPKYFILAAIFLASAVGNAEEEKTTQQETPTLATAFFKINWKERKDGSAVRKALGTMENGKPCLVVATGLDHFVIFKDATKLEDNYYASGIVHASYNDFDTYSDDVLSDLHFKRTMTSSDDSKKLRFDYVTTVTGTNHPTEFKNSLTIETDDDAKTASITVTPTFTMINDDDYTTENKALSCKLKY